MEERLISIDATRGLAALLVVLFHSSALSADEALSVADLMHRPAEVLNSVAAPVRMPLLMFVSGYLGRAAFEHSAKSKLRAQQCFWIYFIWSAVSLLLIGDLTDIPRQAIAPTTALWYVWDLALAYATMPLVRRAPRSLVLASLLVATMLVEIDGTQEQLGVLRNAGRYVIFFYVGLYYGDRLFAALRKRRLQTCAASALVLLAAHWIDSRSILAHVRPLIVSERLASAILVLGVVFSLPAMVAAPLAWLGRRALPIYLGHPAILSWVIVGAGLAGTILSPFVVAALSIAGSIALHRLALKTGWSALYRYPAGWSARLRAASLIPDRCSNWLI